MQLVISLIALAFLPTLAVLGHDAYLFYTHQDQGFMFSTLGYIWTEYLPASHNAAMQALERQPWVIMDTEIMNREILSAILGRKAVELTGALGVILSSLIIVVKLIVVLFSSVNRNRFSAPRRRH